MKLIAQISLLALLLIGAARAEMPQTEVSVPPLVHRVTDLTATLDAGQIQTLESRLAAFEAKKGAQLAVLIVPTTQPEAIEQYSIRVVEQWKLGRKKIDDGVLLLVAKSDRKLRIEVGYGLEGVLPDAIAKRIIAEDITPRFKQGDFYGGIDAGVSRILAVLQGEALPAPGPQKQADLFSLMDQNFPVWLFIGAIVCGMILRKLFGKLLGGAINGGIVGFIVWTLGGSLVIALVAAVFIFFMMQSSSRGYGSGNSLGGFGGGSFGGGFSDSGFSGGGGDFGGGGASGDW